jgi:hypothetical protein
MRTLQNSAFVSSYWELERGGAVMIIYSLGRYMNGVRLAEDAVRQVTNEMPGRRPCERGSLGGRQLLGNLVLFIMG